MDATWKFGVGYDLVRKAAHVTSPYDTHVDALFYNDDAKVALTQAFNFVTAVTDGKVNADRAAWAAYLT